MKNDEIEFIKSTIEEKMNLKIKGFNKIYQATVDGGESNVFHKKCDNIKNTLILYESKGNRRFGGFASENWAPIKNEYEQKDDKNCFLFSIDKKIIFKIEDSNYYKIACGLKVGPSFMHNGTYCIQIRNNAFDGGSLRTVESIHPDIFKGKQNILSEDGHYHGISCKDYEVHQILFF